MKFSYGLDYEKNGETCRELFDGVFAQGKTQAQCAHSAAVVSLEIEEAPRRISMAVENLGTETLRIRKAVALETAFENLLQTNGPEDLVFYTDWDHIWHTVGMTSAAGEENSIWNLKRTRAIYNGGLIRKSDAVGVAMAYETPCRFQPSIRFENGHVTALEYVEKDLKPGERLEIDPFVLSSCQHFGKALKSLHECQTSRKPVEKIRDYFGYNTWEAFGSDITPENIEKSLEAIQKTPLLRENIRYFILDDGWQITMGDWQENERFAGIGMAKIAQDIRAAGMLPGIWTAPFIANGDSQLVQQHPEMFLKGPDGKLLPTVPGRSVFILDITHPETKAFVAQLYQRLYGWGYRYFKTDFLKDAVQPLVHGNPEYLEGIQRYDSTVTPEEAMNAINGIIREAMGEDSFWMGCGTQLITDCEKMDASRTGGDISPRWSRVPMQVSAVVWRLLCNGHRFLADPDFAVLASHDTLYPQGLRDVWLARENEPFKLNAFSGPLFNAKEARTWLSFVLISGGLVNLSDCLYALKPQALEMLEVVYRYAGGPGFMPVDANKTLPSIFMRPWQEQTLVGIFNWEEEEREIAVLFGGDMLPAADTAEDVWSGETLRIDGKPMLMRLQPRSAVVLKV